MDEETNTSLVRGQHEQRLKGEIHLQWVLRVYRIPVSMVDKERREEGKDGEIRLGR